MGEFLQPAVLAAVLLTALNDHWLKTAGVLPTLLTGKISDVTGLIFFPLLLTATLDTLLFFLTKPRSCRPGHAVCLTTTKLAAACMVTGVLFAALQLIPAVKDLYIAAHALIGIRVQVTQDPTDLIALFALPLAYRLGRPFAR